MMPSTSTMLLAEMTASLPPMRKKKPHIRRRPAAILEGRGISILRKRIMGDFFLALLAADAGEFFARGTLLGSQEKLKIDDRDHGLARRDEARHAGRAGALRNFRHGLDVRGLERDDVE